MSPPLAGNNSMATSSRRSSTSSTSTPFATPPTSPKGMQATRIPKPSATSAIPGPSSASSSRSHIAKARSKSASAGADNANANASADVSAWRGGPTGRGVLQPSSSPSKRRPSLPVIQTEGLSKSGSNRSTAASGVKLIGLGIEPNVGSSRVPTVQQNGVSAVAGSSSGISRGPATATSASPTPAGSMHRTKSADSSARSRAKQPSTEPPEVSNTAQQSSRVPRRQHSSSALPRRTHASPRAPVPPVPSPSVGSKTPSVGPSISISQPTPIRPQNTSRIPLHPSSQTSPTATINGNRRRSPGSSRANSAVQSGPQQRPPSTVDLTDDAPGFIDDRRSPRVNGFYGRRKNSDSPRSATPSSRGTSRAASPTRPGPKSSSPALPSARQRQSPRLANGSQHNRSSPVPPLPDFSRRSKLPRAGESTPSPPTKDASRIPEPSSSSPRTRPDPFSDDSQSATSNRSGFGYQGGDTRSSRSRGGSDATATPGVTPHTSPRRRGSNLPSRSPRNSPHKTPGVPTSQDRQANRRISMPPPTSKPSPPVPAKSPLRALGESNSRRGSRSLASSPVPPTSPVPPVPPLPEEHNDGLLFGPQGDSLIGDEAPEASNLSAPPPSQPLESSLSTKGAAQPETLPSPQEPVPLTKPFSASPDPISATLSASQTSSSITPPASYRHQDFLSPRSASPPLATSLSMPNTAFDTSEYNFNTSGDVPPSPSSDFASHYSQDSAPPSAPASSVNLWAIGSTADDTSSSTNEIVSPISESDFKRNEDEMQEILNDSAMYAAQKRTSLAGPRPKRSAEPITPLSRKFDVHNKALPVTPRTPHTPTTPGRPVNDRDPQMRSPSMPTLGNRPTGTMPNGNGSAKPDVGSPNFPRSRTGPVTGGLQPAPVLANRPHSMMVKSAAPSPSPSPVLSRRAHLIREIAHTERSHATDLALIRDAYLGHLLRPDSQLSQGTVGTSGASMTMSLGDSTSTSTTTTPTTPAQESRHSRRSSSYGILDDGKRVSGYERNSGHERNSGYERTSGYVVEKLESRTSHDGGKLGGGHERLNSQDSAWTAAWNGLMSPSLRSPTDRNGDSLDSLYGGSSGAASNSSLHASPLMASPRLTSTASLSGFSRMGVPPGRALSPQDVKTVFINIAQLAQIADELATEFENALGDPEDEVTSPGGEGGSDRLGQVFTKHLQKLRPLYMQYCSRQTVAHHRLLELQADPAASAFLNECWLKVKAHTHAWNLDSMLIKPVQRITKYPLLFEDLLSSTTPVHPDYYAIKSAAEGARALAMEIDEAKRRKDVISSVMGGKSTSTVNLHKDAKNGPGGRLLGLRRFMKDKNQGSGNDPLSLLDISPYAQNQLKELVDHLQQNRENVHSLGQQVMEWSQACKVMVTSDMELSRDFIKWHSLRGRVTNDPRLERVAAYQGVLDGIVNQCWAEMNDKIENTVMLILSKLLRSTKNPLLVIEKLNRKSSEYARFVAHRQAKKNIERVLMQDATEYVSIHTQLLEELPAFLEGWKRIFEMALVALTNTQAEYYASIRDRVSAFSAQYVSEPMEETTDGNGIQVVPLDVTKPRGLHKAWHNNWHEPNADVRSLAITGGDGSRSGTLRSTPKFTQSTWEKSPGSSTMSPALPSAESSSLNHLLPPTVTSGGRRRSMSLMAPPMSTTPLSEQSRQNDPPRPESASGRSFVGLLRRNSHRESRRANSSRRSSKDDTGTKIGKFFPGSDRSSTPASVSRPATPTSATFSPPAQPVNQPYSQTQLRQPIVDRARTKSRSTMASEASQEEKERHSFGLPRIPTDGNQFLDSLTVSTPLDVTFSGLGLGLDIPPSPRVAPAPALDPSETWRASKVLYSCAAVADFNPVELGDQKFKGLSFLPIVAGDLVDVFHEIGRVADLTDFPYSQVGVENDGAVVCRAENGMIGVAMCSFLEPLRT